MLMAENRGIFRTFASDFSTGRWQGIDNDSGYTDSLAGSYCATGWHHCSMVPLGTFSSRSHLLRHRIFADIKADLEIWEKTIIGEIINNKIVRL